MRLLLWILCVTSRVLFAFETFDLHFIPDVTKGLIDCSDNCVFQKETPLVKIISGPENNRIHRLNLALEEDGSIKSLIRRSSTDQSIYSVTEFFNKEAVLARASDRDALLVRCKGCSPSAGGEIKIRYLYNGISMSYKSLVLKIGKRGKRWFLFNRRNRRIKSLKLIKRELMGRTIGIKKIVVTPYSLL